MKTDRLVLLIGTLILSLQFASLGAAADPYLAAARHYALGEWDHAAVGFSQFVQDHPQDDRVGEALFYQGESLVQLGNYSAAGLCFERYVIQHQRQDFAARAIFRWGECAYLTHRHADAERLLGQFVREHPDDELNRFALAYLGRLCAQAERDDEAQQWFQRTLDEYPDGPLSEDCLLQLAKLALKRGDFEASRAFLDQLTTRFPDGELQVQAGYWRGVAHFGQQQYTQARDAFRLVRQTADDASTAAVAQYFLAESSRLLGETADARKQFEELATRWPDSHWADDAAAALVQIAVNEQDDAAALRSAESFLAGYEDSDRATEVRQWLGYTFLRQRDYLRAAELFEQMVNLQEEDDASPSAQRLVAKYRLGIAYLGLARDADAAAVLSSIPMEPLAADFRVHLAYSLANAYVRLGQADGAIELLRAAIAGEPSRALAEPCRAKLIDICVTNGRFEAAAEAMRAWSAIEPASELYFEACLRLADSTYLAADFTAAAEWYAKLLAAEAPARLGPRSLSGLAWTHHQLGNSDDALNLFERLCRGFSDDELVGEAVLMRGAILEQEHRSQEATDWYREWMSAESLTSDQRSTVRWRVARLFRTGGRPAEAIDLLRLIEHQDPQFERMDEVLYDLAWLLSDQRHAVDSRRTFEKINQQFPQSPLWADATFRLAEAAVKAGDLQRATEWLDELQRRSADLSQGEVSAFARYLRGRVAVEQKQWQLAADSFAAVLRESPSSEAAHAARYWLGEAHFQLQQHSQALEQFDVLTQDVNSGLSPDNSRPADWQAMVWLRQSQIHAAAGRWDDARQSAEQVLERYPQFKRRYEAAYVLGRYHMSRAEFDAARNSFQAVIDDEHGSMTETAAMAQWAVGESYFHQRRYVEAIAAYRLVEALYDFPQWRAASLLQAGKCFEHLHQEASAIARYRQLVQQFPGTTFAGPAKERLDALTRESDSSRTTLTGHPPGGDREQEIPRNQDMKAVE